MPLKNEVLLLESWKKCSTSGEEYSGILRKRRKQAKCGIDGILQRENKKSILFGLL